MTRSFQQSRTVERNRALRARAREHLRQLGVQEPLDLLLASKLKFSECADLLGEPWPTPHASQAETHEEP